MPTQREIEMRQGAYIAAMNGEREFFQKHGCGIATKERRDILERWVEAKKVVVEDRNHNKDDYLAAPARDKAVTLLADRSVCWIETFCDTWPSEQLIASVGLAIGALDSFNGVKGMTKEQEIMAAERRRRDEARKHITPPEFWDDTK